MQLMWEESKSLDPLSLHDDPNPGDKKINIYQTVLGFIHKKGQNNLEALPI